jgi:hypothetical protein
MPMTLPLGEFTCPITFERVRPPRPVVKEEGGVSYVVQSDYRLAFRTVLRFSDGRELPIKGKLFGENSQKHPPVVFSSAIPTNSASNKPVRPFAA